MDFIPLSDTVNSMFFMYLPRIALRKISGLTAAAPIMKHIISSIAAGLSLKKIALLKMIETPPSITRNAVSKRMNPSYLFSLILVNISSPIPKITAT